MVEHEFHRCHEDDCKVCLAELLLCEVCGGAEASLPAECPGRRMSVDEMDAVQAGDLQYAAGEWFNPRMAGTCDEALGG